MVVRVIIFLVNFFAAGWTHLSRYMNITTGSERVNAKRSICFHNHIRWDNEVSFSCLGCNKCFIVGSSRNYIRVISSFCSVTVALHAILLEGEISFKRAGYRSSKVSCYVWFALLHRL